MPGRALSTRPEFSGDVRGTAFEVSGELATIGGFQQFKLISKPGSGLAVERQSVAEDRLADTGHPSLGFGNRRSSTRIRWL